MKYLAVPLLALLLVLRERFYSALAGVLPVSQAYWERPHYSEVMEIIEDALGELVLVSSKFQIADKVFERLFEAGYLR